MADFFRQYNVSSIQTTTDNKIYLVCHAVLGIDAIDGKFILDDILSYIDFVDVTSNNIANENRGI